MQFKRRRKGRFLPNRKIRILREYTDSNSVQRYEVITTVYAMRVDMRGTASDEEGGERYEKKVKFVVPKTIRFTAPPPDASGEEAFGDRPFGQVPMGGRGQQSGPRLEARGAQVRPSDAIQDMGVEGNPIFEIVDISLSADMKRTEIVCERTEMAGDVYSPG